MNPTLIASCTVAGRHLSDYSLQVPLDWKHPEGEHITVFYREVVAAHRQHEELPLMIYLQGGPGGAGPRPIGDSGWLSVALERFRVILMDQRGTGASTPVTTQVIEGFDSGEAGATYLENFRADSIIRDAEAIRIHGYGSKPWVTLGQSYGGFLTLSYLSFFPEALAGCLITGGLPSLTPCAASVYARTIPRVRAKNEKFYKLYPADRQRVENLVRTLNEDEYFLPDGDRFTVRRLQSLGIDFGMGPGF
ncbi:MAG: alpha/beta fold hydrolase, partial [Glutamicibacter arilaitensis]